MYYFMTLEHAHLPDFLWCIFGSVLRCSCDFLPHITITSLTVDGRRLELVIADC